jgi:hypothetical protein
MAVRLFLTIVWLLHLAGSPLAASDADRGALRRQEVTPGAIASNAVLVGWPKPTVPGDPAFTRDLARVASRSRPAPSSPRGEVLRLALKAYECGRAWAYFEKPILSIIDYSVPSSKRRLWVIDVESRNVLFHELVAHGRNSGDWRASTFSNEPGSLQSSLGLFRTAETYYGRYGYSLNLVGLEPGVNDRAFERRIVIHAADYVRPEVARWHGRLGLSQGCPALDPRVAIDIIDLIKDGSALFAYYPDPAWLARSRFLACGATRSAGPHRAQLP